jgi:phosphoserine phosphatase
MKETHGREPHRGALTPRRPDATALLLPAAALVMAIGTRVEHARKTLRAADAVCFDVDSTVICKEGIDELAAYLGVGEQVAALTASAMGGSTPFHEALAARLAVMRPSRSQLDAMLADHPPAEMLTPGIVRLVQSLTQRKKRVFLVSGGFRQMIEPVAAVLNIPTTNIFANSLCFNADGSFAGHDPAEPTSRAGGKARVVADLKAANNFSTVVMVGDGATDMEARDVPGGADAFIGFGGVEVRDKVKAGACWFVTDFQDIIAALE